MAELLDCIEYVLENEGTFVVDSGGATKYGCTATAVAEYRGVDSVSNREVRELSREEAIDIYRELYWDRLCLDDVKNTGVATCILDVGINRGVSVGARYAQTVCNALGASISVDSKIGPKTTEAINKCKAEAFIRSYWALVVKGYEEIVKVKPWLGIYKKGWLNRANRLLTLIRN